MAAGGLAWYAADSLRHRREGGAGYELHGEVRVGRPQLPVRRRGAPSAPVSYGNSMRVLVNGDQIFPAYLAAIRGARETVNMLTDTMARRHRRRGG